MIDIDQYVGTVPCTFQPMYFEDGLFALVKSISQRHENRGDNQLVLDAQEGLAQKHLQHRVPREDQAFRMKPGRSVVGHEIPLAYPYQDTLEDDFSFLSQGGDMFVRS